MKIKPFIFKTAYNIQGIEPLRSIDNKYGVKMYFYLIDNSNMNILRETIFINDFPDDKDSDFKWFLNRWGVAVISNTYLLNKWLKKGLYKSLNPENWTKVNVILDGERNWSVY
jgi:hypothetical protein